MSMVMITRWMWRGLTLQLAKMLDMKMIMMPGTRITRSWRFACFCVILTLSLFILTGVNISTKHFNRHWQPQSTNLPCLRRCSSHLSQSSTHKAPQSRRVKGESKRVNGSMSNSTSGVPIANMEFEVVPIEFKANYAPSGEPCAGNGDLLHHSSWSRFKPLKFWKKEKLLCEANYMRKGGKWFTATCPWWWECGGSFVADADAWLENYHFRCGRWHVWCNFRGGCCDC